MTHNPTVTGVPIDLRGANPALVGLLPAETNRRVAARLVNMLLDVVMVVLIPCALIFGWMAWLVSDMSRGVVNDNIGNGLMIAFIGGYAVPLVYAGVQVYAWLAKGNHIGGWMLGLVNVDPATGTKAGARTMGKNLLINVTSSLTLGIMPLICCFTTISPGDRRNIYDRWLDVLVVDTKLGSTPLKPGKATTPAIVPPQDQHRSSIQPVTLARGQSAPPPPPPPPTRATAPQPASATATPPTKADPFGDPFGAPASAQPGPVVPVAPPGASSFIGSTPLSAGSPGGPQPAASPVTQTAAEPIVRRAEPMVVRAGASEPVEAIVPPQLPSPLPDETVVDAVLDPADEVEPARVAGLILDDRTNLAVNGIILLGRNPIEVAELGRTVVMPIVDDMQISKTHLAVGVEDGEFWVMDLNSTNGTRITTSDGNSAKVEPSVRTPVPAGAVVQFGSHTIKARA